jgi:uncharacterized protein YtpQ (UPF0354 family)
MRTLRAFVAALTLGHLCPAGAQETPPRDEVGFVKYMADRIAASAGVRVEQGDRPLTLRVLKADGEYLLSANLDRIRTACDRVQERCAAFVDEYVAGVSSAVTERLKPLEKTSLRIAVRPASYLASATQAQQVEPPVTRPFIGDLSLVLVVDGVRTLRMAHKKDLDVLKLSEPEAFDAARANLATDLKPLTSVLKPIVGKSIGFLEEHAYESSRLVFHEEWRQFATDLGGSLIVAVPTTSVLIYGSGATAESIDALRTFAHNVARKSQRPLSLSLFRWTAQGWEVIP